MYRSFGRRECRRHRKFPRSSAPRILDQRIVNAETRCANVGADCAALWIEVETFVAASHPPPQVQLALDS